MTKRYWGNAHDLDCCAIDIRMLAIPLLDGDDENPDIIRAIRALERIAGDLDGIAESVDAVENSYVHPDDYNALAAELDGLRECVADFERGIITRDELLRLTS